MTGAFYKRRKNENSTPQRVTFAVFTPAKELALAKVLAECKHFPDTPPIPTLALLLASHCGMLRAEILGGGGGGGEGFWLKGKNAII